MTDEEHISFNIPGFSGEELNYIRNAVNGRKTLKGGQSTYIDACHGFFRKHYGFRSCLMTMSCTSALEMASILAEIGPGDEIIMPSYTFVSTANAFALRGAAIKFIDSRTDHPGMDESLILEQVGERTKAIVAVHYAGVACDMDVINGIAKDRGLLVIEDAAHAIDSYYKGVPLGRLGDLSAFSFHETKNVNSGKGGLLVLNNSKFESRAEIVWENGTNRSAYCRGETDKYEWIDIGSSFQPPEILAAFLFAQLEAMPEIQLRRMAVWKKYDSHLDVLRKLGYGLPVIPAYASNNAHMYYLVCKDKGERNAFIEHLKEHKIDAAFHYQPLHTSLYYRDKYAGGELPNAGRYADCLVRLPLHLSLSDRDIDFICDKVLGFFMKTRK